MGKNQTFIPGEYFEWEKLPADERKEFSRSFQPYIPQAGIDEYETIDEKDVLEFNKRWNPLDPLYNDPEYARAQGFPGVPVMPGYLFRFVSARDEGIPPFDRRIGDSFYYTAIGGDLTFHKRVFSGDQVAKFQSGADIRDVTVPDSDVRIWDIDRVTSVYDANGNEVDHTRYHTREGYRKYIDGRPRQDYTENMAEWESYLPDAHYTTDEDYARMKTIWDQECVRGEEPLYWEDVKLGTEIPMTCSDGPVTYMHIVAWSPIPPEHLFTREELLSHDYTRTVFRDRFGTYLDETSLHFGGRNNIGSRMVFYNTTAAFLIARTVTNYIGNQGRISKFSWKLFPFFKELRLERLAEDMFSKVPGMEGRYCDRHGSEGDTVIGRAVVTDKYINSKGEHCVEFALWAETLDGDIIQACPAEAVLPSKNEA